jgi:hypothetical protein
MPLTNTDKELLAAIMPSTTLFHVWDRLWGKDADDFCQKAYEYQVLKFMTSDGK